MRTPLYTTAIVASLALPLLAAAGPVASFDVDAGTLVGTSYSFAAEPGMAYRIEASGHVEVIAGVRSGPSVNEEGLAYGALVAAWDDAPESLFAIGPQGLVFTAREGARMLFSVVSGPLWQVKGIYHVAVTAAPNLEVPEPGGLALAAAGVAAVGAQRRRQAHVRKPRG